ncbi:MAG: hypothetical protein K2O18_17615 [Oscillospiraceae bacterium]|nr:hypothetical protein [Oscillospiraceae bacterium]
MGITFKRGKRIAAYETATSVGELLELARHKGRSLYREERDYWDWRGFDEYIIAVEGRLPYRETPEQYVCRMETREEILAVLALCTEKQRERFLLHVLYEYSYKEVGKLCGCSKYAVRDSITAVQKTFRKFYKNLPHD